jgi:DNA modification methylase
MTENLIKDQKHTDQYSIYNGDCYDVTSNIPDESIDFSVYSPPFCGLYQYSSDHRDMSNCGTREQFLDQYEFLIKEKARITKKGRITAVHCQDINVGSGINHLYDFPADIIRLHEKHGFVYCNKVTIWKEPLKVRMRTMVRSLMHKFVVDDMTKCFTAMPDYILIFTKKGENKVPVENLQGLSHYFGSTPILPNMLTAYNNQSESNFTCEEMWDYLNDKYLGCGDDLYNKYLQADINNSDNKEDIKEELKELQRSNKLSHYIWQRYASCIWDDIRIDNTLKFKDSREEDDEKHVHPLQLDVIQRLIYMYTNEGESVLTPFMGVGSEVYGAVSLKRKGIGIELKDSYYKQAILNLDNVDQVKRKEVAKQTNIFDSIK